MLFEGSMCPLKKTATAMLWNSCTDNLLFAEVRTDKELITCANPKKESIDSEDNKSDETSVRLLLPQNIYSSTKNKVHYLKNFGDTSLLFTVTRINLEDGTVKNTKMSDCFRKSSVCVNTSIIQLVLNSTLNSVSSELSCNYYL